jgi:hypothetical protein
VAAVAGTQFPSQGACTVVNTALGNEIFSSDASSKGLDAGPLLSLTGQAGSWMLALSSTGEYQTLFGSTPAGPNVPPGNYVISGTGGKDIGAFSSPLNVSGNITWTNKSLISTVDRSQPLTVTWSGAGSGSVLLGGYSESRGQAPIDFVCAEDAAKGSFTIPSFILSALPAATNGGVMFIAPHPLSHQVTIPGIDLAYFMDASSDSRSVGYR